MAFKPTPQQLKEILANHKLWLDGKPGGVRADLRYAALWGADLRYADLQYAKMQGAELWYAALQYAKMQGADLSGADLSGAELHGTNLRGADLSGAKMTDQYRMIGAKFHQLSGPAYEFGGEQKYIIWGVEIG